MKMRGFGKLLDGRTAGLYILKNTGGMAVSVTDYGASIVSIKVPDSRGDLIDVALGHDDVSEYETGHGSIGATMGRVANRIGGARFTIGGKTYELIANSGPNCIHGGKDRYSTRLWQTRIPFTSISSKDVAAKQNAVESINDSGNRYIQDDFKGDSVTFYLDSPDGDQGFPGNLHVEVTYTLTNDNELHIDYSALSDADTPFNMTNHSYFNLNGHDSGSVLEQLCVINAGYFTPVDENALPTGEIRSLKGTPLDFIKAKPLGKDLDLNDEQIAYCNGYDHNYVLNGSGYREVAALYSPKSKLVMRVYTDLPGMQLYTANGMDNEPGKGGCVYGRRCAVCFETQFWPDAVNRENFPGGVLEAGAAFNSRTTYKFK
jgi:aldose 1-epimerase